MTITGETCGGPAILPLEHRPCHRGAMSTSARTKLATTGLWVFTDMLTTEQSRETDARNESLG